MKNIGDKCGTNFLRQFILKLGKAVADMRGTASLNPLLNVEIALLSTMDARTGEDDLSSRSHAVPTQRPRDGKSSSPITPTIHPPREAAPARGKGTLGALKKEGFTEAPVAEDVKPKKRLGLHDIEASWPKVVELLSVASREAIKKVVPSKLEGDVLTFSAPADELDDIKERFKKDASIIRGFLESLHETTFRFQLVAQDIAKANEEEAKIMADSEEYDPVDTVVSMFGGEVVDGN